MGYLYIGLIKLISLLPFAQAQRLGGWVGHKLAKHAKGMRKVAQTNVALCYPERSAAEQAKLVEQSIIETAKSGIEMGVMWGAGPEKGRTLVRKVHNLEALTDALDAGKGVLLSAPHLGNWEVMNHVATMYATVTAMYKPAKNKVLDKWMRESRQKTGGLLVPANRDGIAMMFAALEKGQLAGILPDQEPKERSGVIAPFMGVDALTAKLPHELLLKTGARAVFGFAKRLPDAQGFEVYFVAADEDIYSQDVQVSAASMNRTIAKLIELAPEQYQWTYKRFRRGPMGNLYRKAAQ